MEEDLLAFELKIFSWNEAQIGVILELFILKGFASFRFLISSVNNNITTFCQKHYLNYF